MSRKGEAKTIFFSMSCNTNQSFTIWTDGIVKQQNEATKEKPNEYVVSI